jgi:hypothetical protein
MNEREKPKSLDESVEAAVLDADLFVKYQAPRRAVERLQDAIAHHPRSIVLREKLREVAVAHGMEDEAARQCLALVQLYISRENFESAHERLIEAKHINPRLNIAPGLEAIRRARRPDLQQHAPAAAPPTRPQRSNEFSTDVNPRLRRPSGARPTRNRVKRASRTGEMPHRPRDASRAHSLKPHLESQPAARKLTFFVRRRARRSFTCTAANIREPPRANMFRVGNMARHMHI